mmetsp:Transcript_57409/g.129437  ORF Transcript_57409/g.129437 Transcript_57409/m.129437 type:complete len:91 (-) Transcript_57409:1086-1358(-)
MVSGMIRPDRNIDEVPVQNPCRTFCGPSQCKNRLPASVRDQWASGHEIVQRLVSYTSHACTTDDMPDLPFFSIGSAAPGPENKSLILLVA